MRVMNLAVREGHVVAAPRSSELRSAENNLSPRWSTIAGSDSARNPLVAARVNRFLLRRPTPVCWSTTTSDAPSRASRVAATLTAVPKGIMAGGEIVLLAIKPSMWRLLLDSAPWLVTGLLLAAALVTLGRPIPGLSLTATAQVVLLAAMARVGVAVIRWIPTWYVLTNCRILHIRGVRAPVIWAAKLKEIRHLQLCTSPAERWTRVGSISFFVDPPQEASCVWHSVAEPQLVYEKVQRAIEQASNGWSG